LLPKVDRGSSSDSARQAIEAAAQASALAEETAAKRSANERDYGHKAKKHDDQRGSPQLGHDWQFHAPFGMSASFLPTAEPSSQET
jgi:hypothetical protein